MRPQTLLERAKSFRTKKSLGQNFLFSEEALAKIASAVKQIGIEQIVEIGPGIGFLTDMLLARDLSVKAVDLDTEALAQIFPHSRLEKINADALHFDFNSINGSFAVVGNLPFNVGTQILLRMIGEWDNPNWSFDGAKEMVLMFQYEVAERLIAKPSTKAYNPLSLLVQAKSEIEFLFKVPAKYFSPIPKVDAGVVHLKPRLNGELQSLTPEERKKLRTVIKQAFATRRKNLKNSLGGLLTGEQLLALGIEPTLRAETLALTDFIKMAKSLIK